MGWTKRDIITEAFGELALAGHDFDLTPDELQWGLRRLDTMMATWGSQGLHISYAASVTPGESDLGEESGLPLEAVEAVYLGLAVRLAAGKGKALSKTTAGAAKAAFDALMSRQASLQMQEQQLASGTPRGAGRKPWRTVNQPYFQQPNVDPLRNGAAGDLIFNGKTN